MGAELQQHKLANLPDGNHNGLLTPAEILNLQLQADLVVLSACDTGLGRISGDGVNGLARSFLLAGTYRDWETDRKSTRLNSSH